MSARWDAGQRLSIRPKSVIRLPFTDRVDFSNLEFKRTEVAVLHSPGTEHRTPSRHPIVVLLFATMAGVIVDRFLEVRFAAWLATVAILLLASIIAAFHHWRTGDSAPHDSRRRIGGWMSHAALLAVWFALAGAWHHAHWHLFAEDEVGFRVDETDRPICFQAVGLESPKHVAWTDPDPMSIRSDRDYYVLRVAFTAVRDGSCWQPASGDSTMYVFADHGEPLKIAAGDRLRAFGTIRRPPPAANPDDFSFRDQQRSQRRLTSVAIKQWESIEVLGSASPWNPRWFVPRLRSYCSRQLRRYVADPQYEIAAALLLGERRGLPQHRIEPFMKTGTVHLLAISGLHVMLLCGGLFLMARTAVIPPRFAQFMAMGLCVFFAVLSGGRAPVVRATVLVLVGCSGKLLYRQRFGFNSLATAAMLVLALQPSQLFDVGAQLSFLAVATMIWYVPRLTKRPPLDPLKKMMIRYQSQAEVLARMMGRRLAGIALASGMIWLISMPLVMNRFHLVSGIAVVLNLFMWIPVAIGLLSGLGVFALGDIAPPVARWLGSCCETSLGWLESTAVSVSQWDVSHHWVAGPSDRSVLVFYVVLLLGIACPPFRRRWKLATVAAYACLLACAVAGRTTTNSSAPGMNQMTCTFLSVGHGIAVVMEFADGEVWLYDAGALTSPRAVADRVSQYLWARGLSRIDRLFLSHADIDHFNGVPRIAERFPIGTIVTTEAMRNSSDVKAAELWRFIGTQGIPVQQVAAGERWHVGAATAEVLHPTSGRSYSSDNAASLVLLLESQGRRILLSGDIDHEAVARLCVGTPVPCDLAMAPHHGSMDSDPATFCRWCRPRWVVMCDSLRGLTSAGANEYERIGVQAIHTSNGGAVSVVITDGEINVATHFAPQDANARKRLARTE